MNECVVALFRAAEIRRTLIRVYGSGIVVGVVAAATGGLALDSVFGQVPQTLSGAPVQVQPYVPEPGMPLIITSLGAPNPLPIGDATASGDGAGTGDDGNGGGETASGTVGSSTALTQCWLSRGVPWR
jgi:hypothetical protein